MTEAELARLESYAQPEAGAPGAAVEALASEVRRLRGLVKAAEQTDQESGRVGCPWCDSSAYHLDAADLGHTPSCPAFTPEGALR